MLHYLRIQGHIGFFKFWLVTHNISVLYPLITARPVNEGRKPEETLN